MIRSKLVNLSPSSSGVQLGGARGFVLSPAASDPAATFPVTLRVRAKNGDDVEMLIRPGVRYRLSEEVSVAVATCPTAAHVYQLDLLQDGDDLTAEKPAAASVAVPASQLLYDSGPVVGAVDSGVLDLSGVESVEVLVDNVAGAAFRDLVLLSYLADGATLVDSLLLRRCGFGARANGADYDPGRARIALGPSVSAGDGGVAVLYDATSPANAAQDTGPLLTEDAECVDVELIPSGAAVAAAFPAYRVLDDGTSVLYLNQNALAAVPTHQVFGYGGPVQASTVGTTVGSGPSVPRRMRFTHGALGAGVTGRLVVTSRGRRPGTSVHRQCLPLRARLQLAAAGAAAARLIVVGR